MSRVKVTYYGLIQSVVGKQDEEIYLSDEATVRGLLQLLVERYGDEFRDIVLTSDGQLKPTAYVHLNNIDTSEIDGLNTPLTDEDELSLTIVTYVITGG